jgi:hypothetical protein
MISSERGWYRLAVNVVGHQNRQTRDEVAGSVRLHMHEGLEHSVPRGMDVGHIFQCIDVSSLPFVRQANLQPCQDKVSMEGIFIVFGLG